MTPVLEALKQQLSNNQLATYYVEQLLASMSEALKNELTEILQSTIRKYTSLPVISAVLDSSTDVGSHLQAIFDLFPATFFLISNDLYQEPEHFKSAKLLQLAGIASSLTRSPNQNSHIQQFVDSISPADTHEDLIQKISDQNTDLSYFPKIINTDFKLIRKKYKNLVITKDIHDLIDMVFGFQGLLQIFLKYYFELICNAGSDDAAQHIDNLFSNLFATLKYQEIKYWNNYSDSRTLQNQLFNIIKMDSPSQRHPVLRKHLFDSLKQYNPVFKDARSQYTAPDVRQIHMGQLDAYNALSVPRLIYLLRTVSHCKGKSNLVYLLSQTLKSQNQKLFQLNKLIQAEENKSDKELADLVQYFVDKLSLTQERANRRSSKTSGMGTVIQTAESLRKLKAKKLLKEQETRGGLTHDQLNRLMKEKFKKMYQQTHTDGGIKSKQTTDHLTKFASIAQPLLTLSAGESRPQALSNFQLSTQQMLKEISDKGHLTEEEIKAFSLKITTKNKELMSSGAEDQDVIMEQIGIVLTNATHRSQKRYQIKYKRSQARNQQQQRLTYDKVSQFLKTRLTDLYKRVKIDGALTQDKVTKYLSKFTDAAQPLMLDISLEQQTAEIEKFKISTDEILKGFTRDSSLSKSSINRYQNEIQQLTIQLDTPNVEKRSQLIQKIGITLSDASNEADQSNIPATGTKGSKQVRIKPLTQDQVSNFLAENLKRLYERVRKDGALTYDQVSKYLAQFAEAAQPIVIEIPPAQRKKTIAEFKISTNEILADLSRVGTLTPKQSRKFTTIINREMIKLDVDDVQERIQVVDKIGLILADASDMSQGKEDKFDEEFYQKDLIPYGLDNAGKLISMNYFFSFPFGDRKGPKENDWFDYHIRYLKMAVEKDKLKQPVFEKISGMLPHVPKKKYRKYFNIFPSEQFEETTFLAVYDLWQNKALDKLLVEG